MGRKSKVVVSFNDQDRREYLSGFRKRKDQRRKIAKQKLEKRIQEERKALREARRKSNGSIRPPIPQDVEDLESRMKQEIVDLPTHSVTVTQLENLELSQKDLYLGFNHGGISIEPDESGFEESKSANKTAKNRPSRSKKSSSRQDNTEETNPKKLKAHERMLAKLSGKNRPRRNLQDKGPPNSKKQKRTKR